MAKEEKDPRRVHRLVISVTDEHTGEDVFHMDLPTLFPLNGTDLLNMLAKLEKKAKKEGTYNG